MMESMYINSMIHCKPLNAALAIEPSFDDLNPTRPPVSACGRSVVCRIVFKLAPQRVVKIWKLVSREFN